MKTILITGGAGYIGSHTAKAYADNGFNVIVLDSLLYGHREFVRWGEFYNGDIGDESLLKKIFSNHKIDIISHFAALTYVGESVNNPAKYYDNNVRKALVLLNKAVENHVKVFQFSSTCATYGTPTEIPMTENHLQNPISAYGRTKLAFELAIKDYSIAHHFHYSILRYFNAAGASPEGEIGEDHQPETHLIPLILDTAMGRRDVIEIYGDDYETDDGTCIRDYIHVCDLAEAHVLAVNHALDHKENSIYNLGNGNGFSVKEVIETAKQVTKKDIPTKIGSRRAGDPAKLIGSSKKIISELKWKPQYNNLEKIIQTAWNWHQKRFTK